MNFSYRLPKFCRCTNRKRYIKLLRNCGLSRARIQAQLHYVQTEKISYQEAWRSFMSYLLFMAPFWGV